MKPHSFKAGLLLTTTSAFLGLASLSDARVLFQDNLDDDSLATNNGVGGGLINSSPNRAAWTDNGNASYSNNSTRSNRRAIMYSSNSFQSDTGFRLSFEYKIDSIGTTGKHNLSFGLIRSDANLANFRGYNPFAISQGVYAVGANLTTQTAGSRGLNFMDGSTRETLDQSGTREQFKTGETSEVSIEIGEGGYWCYRIDGEYEESGVLLDGFDLDANYHIVVYGQDDNGGAKEINSILLESAPAPGERAVSSISRTWTAGSMDPSILADFKTLGHNTAGFNGGAVHSASHSAPHRLLEILSGGDADVLPLWGNLNRDEPQNDPMLAKILAIRDAGVRVQAYTNSDTFTGSNADYLQDIASRWKNWCDTDPEAQAFVDSQPYHTGVWNGNRYVDASRSHPDRKYQFCYAEFVLKDFSLRYGKYIDTWVFDSASHLASHGDNNTSGVIEEQRIYQAWTNAVRSGNPDIATGYNNSRSTFRYFAYPYAPPVRFEDFAFAHAFGGNNNHAEKVNGNQFNLNYQHVQRIMETNGRVFSGGWDWASQIVGNFNSKVSTTAWNFGGNQAWEEDDFLQWNLESLQNNGSMMWSGSVFRNNPTVMQQWSYDLFMAMDEHLARNLNPGAPNFARAYTVLPDATAGRSYLRILQEGSDLWDPEGDDITSVYFAGSVPSWISIAESSPNSGRWVIGGTPDETEDTTYNFSLRARDNRTRRARSREVTLFVEGNPAVSDSVVTIRKRNASGFAIDGGPNGTNGQNVYLWGFNRDNANQRFVEIDRGGGYFSYQKEGTNFVLDGGRGGADGQNVYLWTASPNNYNQHWQKVSVGNGAYKLIKRNAAFTINGGSGGSNSQNVNLYRSSSNHQNLQWIIE